MCMSCVLCQHTQRLVVSFSRGYKYLILNHSSLSILLIQVYLEREIVDCQMGGEINLTFQLFYYFIFASISLFAVLSIIDDSGHLTPHH